MNTTETKLKQLLELVLKTEIMRNEHQKRLRKALQTKDENDIYSARMAEAISNECERDLFAYANQTRIELQRLSAVEKV